MSEGITPALTPEEWAEATESDRYLADMVEEAADDLAASFSLPDGKAFAPLSRRHALAALALHGQPFGFTREDVTLIKEQIIRWGAQKPPNPALMDLAARIEALLPPEGK